MTTKRQPDSQSDGGQPELGNASFVGGSEGLWRTILENLGDAASITAGTTRVWVNRAYLELFGLKDASEAVGISVVQHLPPKERADLERRTLARQRGEISSSGALHQETITRSDGELRVVQIRAMAVLFENQRASLAILRDVTKQAHAAEALEASLSLNIATLESTADGIVVVDTGGKAINFNRKFLQMWKLPPAVPGDDLGGVNLIAEQLKDPKLFLESSETINADSSEESLDVLECRDGRAFERYSLPHRVNGVVVGRVWSFRDITERHRLESELRWQAYHDPLTDLPNRRGLEQESASRLADCARQGLGAALLVIDLDQFKDVNDTLGHLAGDEILVKVSRILSDCLGDDALLARLGGDEFAIAIFGTVAHVQETSSRILEAISNQKFEIGIAGHHKLGLTASVGIAFYPQHGKSFIQLLSRADIALYRAKELGRNQSSVFAVFEKPEMKAELRLEMRHQIQQALATDGLALYAQPIVNLRDGLATHNELLLRLIREDGKVLSAASFVTLAERFGLIQSIDRWVVSEAIRLAQQKQRSSQEPFTFEVNLSGNALSDHELLALLEQKLATSGVSPAHFVFEVTETAAVANLPAAQSFIHKLKELGCGFALDDFGVGYSSFYQLKNLPVDYLKIDGSFIRNILSNPVDQKLVKAMVAVAQALEIETIAEFVGDAATMALLKDLGVGYAQGYFIGRPRPMRTAQLATAAA